MREPTSPFPWQILAAGFSTLALGAFLAMNSLPEWHALPEIGTKDFVASIQAQLRSVGARLGDPRLKLSAPSEYERAFRRLGRDVRALGHRYGAGISYRIDGTLEVPDVGTGPAVITASGDGEIDGFDWLPKGTSAFNVTQPSEAVRQSRESFARRVEGLLARGESLGGETLNIPIQNGAVMRVRPFVVRPSQPRESLVTVATPRVKVTRGLSDPDAPKEYTEGVGKVFLERAHRFGLFLLVLILFGVLLFRRRLSFRIAIFVGALATASLLIGGFGIDGWPPGLAFLCVTIKICALIFLVALWAVAESLIRDTVPGFTTSLDGLIARRVGPRAGVALLAGLGAGAGLAGLRLLLTVLVARRAGSGVWPTSPSFSIPLFGGLDGAFFEGPFDTAVFVLFVALFRFVIRRERADVAGAILFALYLSMSMPLHPWLGGFAVALVISILFLSVFRRFGFASLLIAATSAALLRDSLAAVRFSPHALLALVVGFSVLGVIALVGFVGARRSPKDDETRIQAPEYVRRIESERRVKYEMDLLSRMQLELLPEHPPSVPGLDLSVRTVLATEAGGDLYDFIVDSSGALWIAAGDVSGHGYSCGIQGAMVKASLMSLIKAGRVPSEILAEVDRVLRCGRRSRLFTTLALLKIDPATGEGSMANAGHPFPLLLAEGKCREIPGSGLPLGQGPARTYADTPVSIPEGGTLLFASDGLFEGPDRFDEPYGYDRPRAVLESVGLWRRPAEAIVESLFTDWRLHVGDGAPSDDTTIVVVRRPSLSW